MAGQALVLTKPDAAPGDGNGYGYGYGDGNGYGNGYGYLTGDGDGYGYGYGYLTGDGDGYGYGYGYGNGDGDGDGYGYGDGNGYGYGYGYGNGDGDGYGYGYGYLTGDGDGYGYGYGYGDGNGDGNGYGDGDGYWQAALQPYLSHELVTAATEAGEQVTLAWWRSTADGQSANGGRHTSEPARPGLLQEVTGPLRLCTRTALHASANPQQWEGERWWIVALLGEIQQDGDKAGALRRLIIEEVTSPH